jgi:hypothetical protein
MHMDVLPNGCDDDMKTQLYDMFVIKYMTQLTLLKRLINAPISSELRDRGEHELPFSLGVYASCKGCIVSRVM